MADFSIEDKYSNNVIVGLDEVGRGSWAGPVVVGAVIINRNYDCTGINDSKTLSKSMLRRLNDQILAHHTCSIGVCNIEEINNSNISLATTLAMYRALEKLLIKPTMIFVDGNVKLESNVPVLNIIKGDSISVSIAAASIIAKVYRDNNMAELAKDYPQYLWHQNVGYGTKKHLEQIIKCGISPHHRINYKPIQQIIYNKTILVES
jgi:ribonuclease HII